MFCNYCRALNPDDSTYCRACGRAIKFPPEGPEVGPPSAAFDSADAPISEIEEESLVERSEEEVLRDYDSMDDEELTQLVAAYEKLKLPLPQDLEDYLEFRASNIDFHTRRQTEMQVYFDSKRVQDPSYSLTPTRSLVNDADLTIPAPLSNGNQINVERPILEEEKVAWWWYLIGPAILVLLLALSTIIVYGAVWVSNKLYPIVEVLSLLGFIVVVVCLPLSLFKRIRRICGKGIVNVSYLWGVGLWMYSVLVLYSMWGGLGLFIGFFTLGYVTLPLACIAALFTGEWGLLGELVLTFVLVFGTRLLGLWITSKASDEEV